MKVNLLNYTPLSVADAAIGKCYDKGCHTDIDKMTKRIDKVANVKKHASTIEHISYNFDIDGVSRALLQELSRHRIASYSVKSTRYTLKELKKADETELDKFLVLTGNGIIDEVVYKQLEMLRHTLITHDMPNDIAKYMLPEAYKTSLVMTINARSLQNFIALRSDKHALWEIQDLAKAMYNALPEEHKFLFSNFLKVC